MMIDVSCALCRTVAAGVTEEDLAAAAWFTVRGEFYYCPACTGPTVASLAQSIRELGEMLAVADQHPNYFSRLLEVERLAIRVGDHVGSLLELVSEEYAKDMAREEVDDRRGS